MNINWTYIVIMFPPFLLALTIHEIAHALTANWGGDLTATYQDRLSLNPIVHIDLFGTILIPFLMITTIGGFFGWAKPVPVQEQNFRDKAWNVVVSLAGPFSNVLLALFGSLLFSFGFRVLLFGMQLGWWNPSESLVTTLVTFARFFITINWLLCCFNLIPVPPLDGSHVLYHFLIRGRGHLYGFWDMYRRFGLIVLILLIWTPGVGTVLIGSVRMLTNLTIALCPWSITLPQSG